MDAYFARPFRTIVCLGLLLVASLAAPPARAAEFCVETAAELISALSIAQFRQADGEMTIRIEAGTYALGSYGEITNFLRVPNTLRLLGGYGNECATRSVDPINTRLDFGGEYLRILSYGDAVTVEGVHLRNLRRADIDDSPDCTPRGETFTFRRNIVESLHEADANIHSRCHDIRVDNNLVIGGGGMEVAASPEIGGLQALVANNTVVGSGHYGLWIGKGDGDSILFQVHNNILWNNVDDGLMVDTDAAVTAYHNTWDGRSGPLLVGVQNSEANPGLLADHRLSTSSPSVNSGYNALPGGLPANDNDGGPRRIGSTVDRGAFESAMDDSFTQVVTNTNDSGVGSLRQAILSANADPGFNRIEFDMPTGSGQCVLLQPATPYPGITGALLIDGTSQPGSAVNTLEHGDNASICVRIVDLATPRMSHAIDVPPGAGASVTLTLQGIAFGGFEEAVRLRGGSGHMLFGNHFGTGVASLFPPNTTGLASGVPDVRVGGVDPSTRNVFAGNDLGLRVSGAGSRVTNNYIGTSRNGQDGDPASGLSNDVGLRLPGGEDIVVSNNVISGNDIGVDVMTSPVLLATPPRLTGNRIGLRAKTICIPAPGSPCSSVPNRIGIRYHGPGSVTSNSIAYNVEDGAWIGGAGMQGARLSANRMFSNGGLGIDIAGSGAPEGPNPEGYDGSGGYSMPNWGQNAPVIDAASGGASAGSVQGVLRSRNDSFRIEVFSSASCDPSDAGEGEVYHGFANVTITDAVDAQFLSGEASFSIDIERGDAPGSLVGRSITATATRSDGSTSEFSRCVEYVDDGSGDVLFADGFEG